MFVKIARDHFINTNNIEELYRLPNELTGNSWIVITHTKSTLSITAEAAAHLLAVVEAQSAISFPGEPNYIDVSTMTPESQPLTSRIAQLLRDELPQGATMDILMDLLHADYHKIYAAVDTLLSERVAILGAFDGGKSLIFHAIHKPQPSAIEQEASDIATLFKSILDPSTEDEASASRPGEDSEQNEDRTTES